MLWRRLGLVALISPALALAIVGTLLVPPGVLVSVPIIAAILAFVLVLAQAEQSGSAGAGEPADETGTDPAHERRRFETAAGSRRRGGRVALLAAAACGAAVPVVAGLEAVAGPATVPLLLLAGLAAVPWAWPRLRTHFDRRTDPHRAATRPCEAIWTAGPEGIGPNPATSTPPMPSRTPEGLSTRALCAAWQRSYFDLLHAPDQRARGELVELRRVYLNELARRDPAGIERWLGADPRAAGADPCRHFTRTEPSTSWSAPRHPAGEHPSRFRRNSVTPPPAGED